MARFHSNGFYSAEQGFCWLFVEIYPELGELFINERDKPYE